jgi:hypothetical protein
MRSMEYIELLELLELLNIYTILRTYGPRSCYSNRYETKSYDIKHALI